MATTRVKLDQINQLGATVHTGKPYFLTAVNPLYDIYEGIGFMSDDGSGRTAVLGVINENVNTRQAVVLESVDTVGSSLFFMNGRSTSFLGYGLSMQVSNSFGLTFLSGTATTQITDSRATPVGLQYNADYSASFTARSMVDKGYVDAVVAGSGGSSGISGAIQFSGGSGIFSSDATNFFFNDTANQLQLAGGSGYNLLVSGVNGGIDVTAASSITGAQTGLKISANATGSVNSSITNTNTSSGTSNARLVITTSTGGGDPYIQFNTAEVSFAMGVDNSNSDKFVMGVGTDPSALTTPTLTFDGSKLGVFQLSPTAQLHIGAHTTSAGTAPIKLTSGTAMTTPEDGAIEYHGSHLYFTIGSTRYQIDQQSGGSGDLVNGGQSTGSVVSYGTTDANDAAIKTNSITRFSITGGASTGGVATLTNINANTNTVQNTLIVSANSSNTPLASYGTGILLQGKSDTVIDRDMGKISAYWITAADATREAAVSISTVNSGNALVNQYIFAPAGFTVSSSTGASGLVIRQDSFTTATAYTLGGSGNTLTLGGSSGIVTLSSSNTNGIVIGSGTISGNTPTSGLAHIRIQKALTQTGTAAEFNLIDFASSTLTNSGGTGISRSLLVNPSLVTIVDYRAIEIPTNNANAKGIYQSGALTTNNFVGNTMFGSTSAPTTSIHSIVSTATTNAIQDVLTIGANCSTLGSTAANFGVGITFTGGTTFVSNRTMATIASTWDNASDGGRLSNIVFKTTNVASFGELMRFDLSSSTPTLKIASALGTTGTTTYQNAGITTGTAFTLGNSSSALTLGGNSGTVTISSSGGNGAIFLSATGSNATPIKIVASDNTATATAGITFGNATSFTQTSGTRNYITYDWSFSPTSGTAVHNQLSFTGTLNQSGTANGIVRGINIAHTVTAVVDYRAIEIADDGANVKPLYITGTTATNRIVPKTSFGTTTAPTALIMLAAGTSTASTAPLKFTSGTNLTTPEAGAVEWDGTNLTVTQTTGPTRKTIEYRTVTVVTGATAIVNNEKYMANSGSQVVFTLPSTASVGDTVRISGWGLGGWKVAQNASQTISSSTATTTTGTGGSITSINRYDQITLMCTVANTNWVVVSTYGTLTYV